MPSSDYNRQVFINCPLDPQYEEIFNAITFAVFDCGFQPRSALEIDDGAQVRIGKLFDIIAACRFGIHDISRTELDPINNLPRFNMPLELGIFLGARKFGRGKQKDKIALILDSDRFRYQKFISDIAGQDPRAHQGSASEAITAVRNWLRTASSVSMPGGEMIARRFAEFSGALPKMCEKLNLERDKLIYADRLWAISSWLEEKAT